MSSTAPGAAPFGGSLVIEEIASAEALESLRQEWMELYDHCSWATPFQSPDWLIPWWRHLGRGRLLIMTARLRQRLVGLAPLYVDHVDRVDEGEPARDEIKFLGDGVSDYGDFLFDSRIELDLNSGGVGRIVGCFLDRLRRRSGWDACVLRETPERSPLVQTEALAESGVSVSRSGVCPIIELPDDPSSYLRTIDPKQRRSINQSRRRSAFLFEAVEKTCVEEAMEQLFCLHRKRWRQRSPAGEEGVLGAREIQAFHREVAASFATRDALALYRLKKDGIVCAVLYGFRRSPRVYAYISGFDPDLETLSPGAILIWSSIEDSITRGFREFDFLRGGEKYKYLWGARDHVNSTVTVDRVF